MKDLEKHIKQLKEEKALAFKDGRLHDMDAARRMLELLREWNGREDLEDQGGR